MAVFRFYKIILLLQSSFYFLTVLFLAIVTITRITNCSPTPSYGAFFLPKKMFSFISFIHFIVTSGILISKFCAK